MSEAPGTAAKSLATLPSGLDATTFAPHLFSHAPAEDLAQYGEAERQTAANLALAALARHRRGEAVVTIDTLAMGAGSPVSVITLVNDNMPFLFDSVQGEVAEEAGEPLLVMHPVLRVETDPAGRFSGLSASSGEAVASVHKVSLIQIHVPRLASDAAEALAARLHQILEQVRAAVTGWRPMLDRLQQAIDGLRALPGRNGELKSDEAVAFLEWLRDDNFIFLGMREFRYVGDASEGALERIDAPGLGILADADLRVLRRGNEPVVATREVRAFLHGPEPLLVTKANTKTAIHRRAYLDYVGVKTYTPDGELAGELRIVGLFTSTAYTRSVMNIPFLSSRARAIISELGFDPADHNGKALIHVLESYPRDELFQVSQATLRDQATAIMALGERPRVRVLTRTDQFDRFVSVIVFVPRDRYDSRVRERIGAYLSAVYDGHLSAFYPAFPEGSLARVHFIIGRSEGVTPQPSQAELENAVRSLVRTWDDALRDVALEVEPSPAALAIAGRLPEAYREGFAPADALVDAERIGQLSQNNPIYADFYRRQDQALSALSLKIYHVAQPLPLSQRVPVLEQMGFRVISERTFEVPGDGKHDVVFVHDMELEPANGRAVNLDDAGALLESVFLSVWRGKADNDGYNGLALSADLQPDEIVVLRAYGRYLQQAGIPQSQDFIAAALNRYPEIARNVVGLFNARLQAGDADAESRHEALILKELDEVPNLDDDTILRRILNLVQSTLRTNHFVPGRATGDTLALKLESRAITLLPEPRPWREIFVYGADVEGVHLRFGPVARGGLRWSDRAQDYRTEVLGLVKAQQVKNAVIVPVGAKGGFYPKKLPTGGTRDAIFAAGKQAYVTFVSTLLSITDNIVGDAVVPPAGVLRRDGDDPYFVVAADKGTATFSDTANAISQSHDFWLDDAFASGGSAGYDHKKMGITARGAWEAVKRHFREMDRDIQTQPFTVAGVGDMSGDVFGNGMLLSREIRLVAAFDHRDIFLDPSPDAARSFAERQRLFDLPRSSWQDYNAALLSPGGMIVPRSQKAITLSGQAAELLQIGKTVASPNEIMTAILRLSVDLLWFGGIGTYVRATTETNADVGDRANDAIRITAPEIGAKVIGEGANLGVTQRARIEYGLNGGRCNSDAIDNSGGVNSSDVEVNIKIALASAMRSGSLSRDDRNVLLSQMTEEVAALVLKNNYCQTLALSLAEQRGLLELPHQRRFILGLEERGLLDRVVEVLPSDSAIAEREQRGVPLTRPELGVLLAYAKLTLFGDLVATALPDEPHYEGTLLVYFPAQMQVAYRDEILSHRLRREIIATELANDVIDRGGPTFVSRLQDLTGTAPAEIVQAYTLVRDGFELDTLYAQVNALDARISGDAQLDLYGAITRLAWQATSWQLRNDGSSTQPLGVQIDALKKARTELEPQLQALMPSFVQDATAEAARTYAAAGAGNDLAQRLAMLEILRLVPEILQVADRAGTPLLQAAQAFFAVTEAFRIGRIEDAAASVSAADYYEGLALARAMDTIGAARRRIAAAALGDASGGFTVEGWVSARKQHALQARDRLKALTESGDLTVARLTVAAGVLADLAQE